MAEVQGRRIRLSQGVSEQLSAEPPQAEHGALQARACAAFFGPQNLEAALARISMCALFPSRHLGIPQTIQTAIFDLQ